VTLATIINSRLAIETGIVSRSVFSRKSLVPSLLMTGLPSASTRTEPDETICGWLPADDDRSSISDTTPARSRRRRPHQNPVSHHNSILFFWWQIVAVFERRERRRNRCYVLFWRNCSLNFCKAFDWLPRLFDWLRGAAESVLARVTALAGDRSGVHPLCTRTTRKAAADRGIEPGQK
jgi:hypothetical protein